MDHRRKISVLAIGVFLALGLSGCGKSTGVEQAALSTTSYSYEALENGCDTGLQQFGSLAEECTGLQSEPLNHFCAQSARRTFFAKKGCPGTFTPSYS